MSAENVSKVTDTKPNLSAVKKAKKGNVMNLKSENEDLNLHVRLCAERYDNLQARLDGLNTRITKLEDSVSGLKTQLTTNFLDLKLALEASNNKRNTQFIVSAGAIVVSIITALGVYLSRH
jgi:chromosome segregation ATPase